MRPSAQIVSAVTQALGGRAPLQVDATVLATALLGDAIAANLFMLGYAWQQGLVPISYEAIMRAVELNGAAIEMNKQAFAWGRLAVIDPAAVFRAAGLVHNAPTAAPSTLAKFSITWKPSGPPRPRPPETTMLASSS